MNDFFLCFYQRRRMSDKHSSKIIGAIVAVLAVAVLFMLFGCKITCGKSEEHYKPGGLASSCYGLTRSPVDFVFKHDKGYQHNPHYQTNPMSMLQPLEHGPIDFYHELRRLEDHGKFGTVFDWQGANYSGSGRPIHHISNDEHNRYNLTHIGSQGKRNYMDNIYSDLFGTPGFQNTEQRYVVPNPDRHRIYGGPHFLTHDNIGN